MLRGLYNFYFRKILPRTATLISGDKTGAYKYLPESGITLLFRRTVMHGDDDSCGLRESGSISDDFRGLPLLSRHCGCKGEYVWPIILL